MGKKVLITGGAGFIGSHVVRKLLSMDYEVYIYDSFIVYLVPDPAVEQFNPASRLKGIYDKVHLIRGDTLNRGFFRRTITEVKPDVIIHMAAMPLAALAIEQTEEAFKSILTSTHIILEMLRDIDFPCRLLYTSSSMVYGDFVHESVSEEDSKDPKDVYGAFKLAGETVVRAYAKNYKLDTVICRPSAVYGPFDANDRVVRKFINNAMNNQPMVLHGDGGMRMDFTYVEDTALALALCATTPEASGKIFNVTRGESRSLKDLAEIVRQHFPKVEVIYKPAPAFIPKRGALSIEHARKVVGFVPQVSLEEGVRRYVEHLRTNTY
jgi:nucleoside-diphosphate-sugar epimerase